VIVKTDQLLELSFEFVVFSDCSELNHRQLADSLHMAAVEWAEKHSLGVGGGFRMGVMKSGSFSCHQFGLSVIQDGQSVTFQDAQILFEFLRTTSRERGLN
jgi:hypothetical protein